MKWLDKRRADKKATEEQLRIEKHKQAAQAQIVRESRPVVEKLNDMIQDLYETPVTPKAGSKELLLKTEKKYASFKATIEHTPTKDGAKPFVTNNVLIFTDKAIITTTNKGRKLRYPYTSLDKYISFEPNELATKLGTFYISSKTATLKLDMTLTQFKKLTIIDRFIKEYIIIDIKS